MGGVETSLDIGRITGGFWFGSFNKIVNSGRAAGASKGSGKSADRYLDKVFGW